MIGFALCESFLRKMLPWKFSLYAALLYSTNLKTYDRVVSAVQYPACVGTLVCGVEGAGVSAATLKTNWEEVSFTVVGRAIVDDLEWREQRGEHNYCEWNYCTYIHVQHNEKLNSIINHEMMKGFCLVDKLITRNSSCQLPREAFHNFLTTGATEISPHSHLRSIPIQGEWLHLSQVRES